MKKNPSKQKLFDAAASLFFQKGFHGTSVRDIAEKAMVNVSLISYYFKNKQGLLEYGVTKYYELYMEIIEKTLETMKDEPEIIRLKKLIEVIIQYKQNNHQFSCFITRELSLDSIFVREMLVTYLAKENYYISNELFAVLNNHNKGADHHTLLMQLKGMLVTPYILQHDWKQQAMDCESHRIFAKHYAKTIHNWVDFLVS